MHPSPRTTHTQRTERAALGHGALGRLVAGAALNPQVALGRRRAVGAALEAQAAALTPLDLHYAARDRLGARRTQRKLATRRRRSTGCARPTTRSSSRLIGEIIDCQRV